MKVEEESAQLLEELRQLRRQVTDLRDRVCVLEADGAAPPAPAEEREGDFGPAIKRSTSTKHQSAVSKALTMLGVLPPEAETTKSRTLSASHQRALARMKQMGGSEPEPEAPANDLVDDTESTVADGEVIPLPELRDDAQPQDKQAADVAPVELDTALAIDLVHPTSRAPDLARLLLEAMIVSGLLVALPVHQGILAAVGFIALLAMPQRHVLRAHARFLSLVVLARCGFPEVWSAPSPLQLPAMLAACLPAFAVVLVGRVGWAVQAFGMASVAGVIALAQGAVPLHAAGIGAVVLGLVMLWRRVGR